MRDILKELMGADDDRLDKALYPLYPFGPKSLQNQKEEPKINIKKTREGLGVLELALL